MFQALKLSYASSDFEGLDSKGSVRLEARTSSGLRGRRRTATEIIEERKLVRYRRKFLLSAHSTPHDHPILGGPTSLTSDSLSLASFIFLGRRNLLDKHHGRRFAGQTFRKRRLFCARNLWHCRRTNQRF